MSKKNQKAEVPKHVLNKHGKKSSMLQQLFADISSNKFERLLQVIPSHILAAPKEAASVSNTSLQEEVILRLAATLIEPRAFGFNPELEGMIYKKFNLKQAQYENKLCRRGWGYLYEQQKLKNFLDFKPRLPRDFKESFQFINVQQELKALRAKRRREENKRRRNED